MTGASLFLRHAARVAVSLLMLGACSSDGDKKSPANPSPEVRAVMDKASSIAATFPVRAYAGSIQGSRAAVPLYFPEWATLAQGGAEDRAAMLEAFTGKAGYEADVRLAIFAYALESQLDAAGGAQLRRFLADNLTSDLDWTPHFLTHALRRAQGARGAREAGWYTGFEIAAAAAGKPNPTGLTIATSPARSLAQTAGMVPPRCKKRWLLAGADGKPLSHVDPSDGKTKPVAIEGDEHASAMVPSDLASHWRTEVANGGGTYVNDDPEFVGMPSKQFNCGGYAFRELNGGKRWTLDPHQAHRTLLAAGVLEEVPDAQAKPGDKVFFMGVEEPDTVKHVAEVKSVGGLVSTSITLRNADQASGLWETDLNSKYYSGGFLGLGTKPHYGGHKIYRYKAGKPPQLVPDPESLKNPAYCGGMPAAGQGTLEVNLDVPNRLLSFRPTMYGASREADCPTAITMVACKLAQIEAIETDPAGALQERFQILFDSTNLSAPGSFVAGDALNWNKHDGSVPVSITFLTHDFKDAENTEPLFWSTAGSVDLTTWNPSPGGRMIGTFQATIEVSLFVTGRKPSGEPILEEVRGTIRGAFDLPVP